MTHTERRQRRIKIAKVVKNGSTIQEAAQEFGVAVATVYSACLEHGVSRPRGNNCISHINSFSILYKLLQGRSPSELVNEFRLSRQRIHQIIKKAETAGFKITKGVKRVD